MKINSNEINYKQLMMLEHWSCKDAALIICGFDPDNYRYVRFTPKQINQESNLELIPAYKLYKIFESVNQNRPYNNRLRNPISYINVCHNKDWPVVEELVNLARERYLRESPAQIDLKVKDSTLKTLAAIVMLYVSEKKSPELGTIEKVNVSRLAERILQFLENHNINVHGLGKSSLNEKIAQALNFFKSKENFKIQ